MNLREGLEIGARQHLFIGGCDTVALAREYGTPLYVVDEGYLRGMCRSFVRAMKKHAPGGRVSYASKAFTNQAMCRIMLSEDIGLDVVSGGELTTALQAGYPMDRVTYHGNVKTIPEIELAIQNDVGHIVIDSRDEIFDLQQIAQEMGKQVRVLVRLNPGVAAHTNDKVQTAVTDCKFGLGIDDGEALGAVKDIMACPNLKLVGVHTHIGSQILEWTPYYEALDKLTDFMVLSTVVTGCELLELNIGGGYGVRYVEEQEAPISPDRIVGQMAEALRTLCARKGMRVPTLAIEPGRAIIAESGITLYTVEVIKDIKGVRKYVAVDGGMMDNPRPALYGSKYSALLANRAGELPAERVSIAGRACESGDMLMWDVMLPEVKRGDLLAMLTTGAYQYAMASNYNRVPHPAVVLVQYGRSAPMVSRQKWEDVTQYDRMPAWLRDRSK